MLLYDQFPETTVAAPEELMGCPVDNTFKFMGKKFIVLILRNIIYAEQKIYYDPREFAKA